MVNTGDIRKGNRLLFYKPLLHEPQQLTVKGWYYNENEGLWYVQSDEYTDINEAGLMPIPLTPNWLEKCGFEYSKGGDTWFREGMNEFITWHYEGFAVYESTKKLVIKNVHHLQNLFFALTGEELTIKN